MACGADEYVCQVMVVLRENEFVAGALTKLIGQIGEHTVGIAAVIFALLKEHGEKLIGLLGFAFGVWRWWKDREHIMHKRLEEYLKESDKRLRKGQDDVLEALHRPGPSRAFLDPLFIPSELRSVLRERHWDKPSIAATVERSADIQLSKAAEKIERQLSTARQEIQSLHQQMATAHILKGAVAASSARRNLSAALQNNTNALMSFKTALQVPGQERNALAKELEAHQLRKLGQSTQAMTAYEILEELAFAIEDQRDQKLMIARAKRYQAELLQRQAAVQQPGGLPVFAGTLAAFGLLSPNAVDSALSIRHDLAPFQEWDLIEQAELHYLTAFIARNLNFNIVEGTNLDHARTSYAGVLAALPRQRLWSPRRLRRLRTTATAGENRVSDAMQGKYDVAWLFS